MFIGRIYFNFVTSYAMANKKRIGKNARVCARVCVD